MKSKIRRILHDLLIQDSISLESNIVNDLVCQMIGLETKKTDIGFDLSVHQWKKEDETIYFNVSKISYADLIKCLDFFKIPHENYITDKSIVLDNKEVLNELLAKFEALYQSLKVENPSAFAQYQVKSRPILEASAIATIGDYSKKALQAINIDEAGALSDLQKDILDTVILLSAKISLLSTYPSVYKSVNEMDQRIKAFIDNPELSNNKELLSILKLISEGNALFKQYHRYESVIANKKFKKEIETFLNTSVAISATQCDVTENTLLQLAGAILGPKGKASYDTGSDKSRLVFNFTDITKENAEKLVTYCLKMGDETASLGYGSRKHGSVLAQSAKECMRMESSFEDFNYEPQIVLESHSIEVDGEFFYNTIFPELKKVILEMDANNSDVITSYREASKTYLEKKAALNSQKISDNKSTLFQATQPTNDIVSTTSSLSI